MKGILGRKVGMSQVFTENGMCIPVSVIEVAPNVVLKAKTIEKDGYIALQLAMGEKRDSLINKPNLGQFSAAKTSPKRFIREIRNMSDHKVGNEVKVDIFQAGEFVDVTAVSKGKGFAGVIKRNNQSIGPKSHGSHYHRAIGSMGAISPNRVLKGKAMPGHMGHEQVTMQNLEVIQVDVSKNALLVKGSVPGPRKQLLIIRNSAKVKLTKKAVSLINRSVKDEIASKQDGA